MVPLELLHGKCKCKLFCNQMDKMPSIKKSHNVRVMLKNERYCERFGPQIKVTFLHAVSVGFVCMHNVFGTSPAQSLICAKSKKLT